jgi:SAM-dependent methyltransferase
MSWKEIAKTTKAKEYIHPSGNDILNYNKSGQSSAKNIQKYIPLTKVMEYGCGDGRILRHIKDCEIIGVDIVPEFVLECKKNGLLAEEIKNYKFKEDCDIVYSITVFIHLSKKDGYEALENIWKALKTDGIALLQIPIYETSKEPNSFIDVGTWTENELKEVCDNIGFDLIEAHCNKGSFSYENIGKNHEALQILKKR